MNEKDRFYISQPPLFHLVGASLSDITNFGWSLITHSSLPVAIRFLRGKKMLEVDALFDEFAAAMQFPYYFGENWQAFDECLADLEWIKADSYILIITNSESVLSEEDEDKYSIFIGALHRVAEEWGQAINNGEAWDRPAKAFHIIFHTLPTNLEKARARLNSIDALFRDFSIQ